MEALHHTLSGYTECLIQGLWNALYVQSRSRKQQQISDKQVVKQIKGIGLCATFALSEGIQKWAVRFPKAGQDVTAKNQCHNWENPTKTL